MIVVGITGIIGSGKSTVSKLLSEYGYSVIDLDLIAQSLLDQEDVREEIKREFGESVIRDGKVDRKALADVVFKDEFARKRLEEMVHPRVVKSMLEMIELERRSKRRAVFVDGPLIFEAGIEKMFDKIVVVYAEEGQIVKRMENRGFKKEDVLRRLKSQIPLDAKAEKADYVIYNTGDLKHLRGEVERLIRKIDEWEGI